MSHNTTQTYRIEGLLSTPCTTIYRVCYIAVEILNNVASPTRCKVSTASRRGTLNGVRQMFNVSSRICLRPRVGAREAVLASCDTIVSSLLYQ